MRSSSSTRTKIKQKKARNYPKVDIRTMEWVMSTLTMLTIKGLTLSFKKKALKQ